MDTKLENNDGSNDDSENIINESDAEDLSEDSKDLEKGKIKKAIEYQVSKFNISLNLFVQFVTCIFLSITRLL